MVRAPPVDHGLREELETAARRREPGHVDPVDLDASFSALSISLVAPLALVRDLEGAVTAHVAKRVQSFPLRRLRETGHAVPEDVAEVLVEPDGSARSLPGFVVSADAARAVGIDRPRERDPELGFLPDLSGIRPECLVQLLAVAAPVLEEDGLPESDPGP